MSDGPPPRTVTTRDDGPAPVRRRGQRAPAAIGLLVVGLALSAGCTTLRPGEAPDGHGVAGDPGSRPVCARVFSTNDTHGRLLAAPRSWSNGRPVGGSAVLAAYLGRERARTPGCPVFVVSGGDLMQGTLISNLTGGASTIRTFDAIGYDVAAIGNHEFDWGVDVLRQRVAEADFPLLGANIYLKGTNRHPSWVRPWAIVERDGVRIGFIGMTTETTPRQTRPSNVVDFEFRPIAETLDRYIPELRARGVDFVVAVMHAGGFCDASGVCRGEALDELERTRARYDYVVTGHTHSRVETSVHGAPVIQSLSNSTAFGLGRLDRDATGAVAARIEGVFTTWADEIEPDPDVAMLVEGFRAEVADVVDRPVTVLAEPAVKPRRGEFPLGRLIADAQREAAGTQVAIMNNGGIRTPLPAGPISYGTLFELQPFGNALVRLRLRGADLIAALEHGIREDGVDLNVSGVRIAYDPGGPAGHRIREVRLADGTTVARDAVYTVAVNDFMATGGGGYTMFENAVETEPTGIVDLDALIGYLQSRPEPLRLPDDPRWLSDGTG